MEKESSTGNQISNEIEKETERDKNFNLTREDPKPSKKPNRWSDLELGRETETQMCRRARRWRERNVEKNEKNMLMVKVKGEEMKKGRRMKKKKKKNFI